MSLNSKFKSIFSITRASYINSGHISDYFIEFFETYTVLSFSSHNTNREDKTKLMIYKNGLLKHSVNLLTLPKNPPVFIVPFYQVFFCLSIIWALILLRFKFKIIPDICVTSFALWALSAHLMRIFGFCKRTIFWSWDYFPKIKGDPYYLLLTIFEPFDKIAISICDYSWYASQSNLDKRIELGQIKDPENQKHSVVHWGTGGNLAGPVSANLTKTGILRLVYFGSINSEKGLDIVIDALTELAEIMEDNLEVLIIGGNTLYKEVLIKEVNKLHCEKYVNFKGFMSTQEFDKIAKSCDLGLALFVPEIGGKPNFTYYADPSKPRDYLANGLPVLITPVPFIHKDISRYNAGIVLEKYNKQELIKAVSKYIKNPEKYRVGAYELAQVDRYDVYYSEKFAKVYSDLEN